jgi:acyl carrier protein
LTLARLLIELESKLGVQLMDEYLMTVDLVHVSDLVSLVERAAPAAK